MRELCGLLAIVGLLDGCVCSERVVTAPGRLDVQPPVVDFGTLTVSTSSTRALRLSNQGEGTLSIEGVELSGADLRQFQALTLPITLRSGELHELAVSYAPTGAGAHGAILTLKMSGAAATEATVPLIGRATMPTDAGVDAGQPDAGQPDAGQTDAGVDAGMNAGLDAGEDAGIPCADGGVGCHPRTLRAYQTYACVLLEDSRVLCWGLVPESCCTQPYWRSQPPTQVMLPLAAGGRLALEGGGETMCVRRDQGPVACQGRQVLPGGQLALIPGLSRDVANVFGGETYLCATRLDAGVDCWGTGIRIVDGAGPDAYPFPNLASPTPVPALGAAEDVSLSSGHLCARRGAALACWGYNGTGSACLLGDQPGVRLPGVVTPRGPFDAGVSSVLAHDRGACVIEAGGGVNCWGSNLGPPGGQGYFGCTATPLNGFDQPVTSLCTGGQFACALQSNGTVRCWGENYRAGVLGYISDSGVYDQGSSTPLLIAGVSNAVQLTCGQAFACAMTADGRVLCWGSNSVVGTNWGTLGIVDAGLPFSPTPIQVPLPR